LINEAHYNEPALTKWLVIVAKHTLRERSIAC